MSSEMCSLHLTIQVEQWTADPPGEQLGVRCLAQGSHLSRGQFLPEPGFEPTTSGYKSNALSIRPRLPRVSIEQRFSIPVFVHPRSAYFACLSLLTHLIQIISSLEVCSVHELCSDWHAPYTGSIAPYSLSRENPLKFTSLQNIH